MYDMKSEPNEFVGEDRAEAVAKACRFFDVKEDELTINEPEVGFIFGAGNRSVIVAHITGRRSSAPRERDRDRDRGDRDGGRDGGRERGRGRDRGRSSDRGEGRSAREGRGRDDSERRPRERSRDRSDRDDGENRDRARASKENSKATVRGELGVIGKFLVGVLERMVIGPFEISEESEGDFLIYQLRGDAAQALGSGDGRAVDALQLLANQAAMHEFDESTRVIVDAEGDADRRGGFLERLADRAAGRAQDTKRSVALDPMNPKDRRILHMAVREMDGVVTMSVGSGRYRQVVVVPEGAPEYEEALEASNAAQSRSDD